MKLLTIEHITAYPGMKIEQYMNPERVKQHAAQIRYKIAGRLDNEAAMQKCKRRWRSRSVAGECVAGSERKEQQIQISSMAGIGESQKQQLMTKDQEFKPEKSNGVSTLDELREKIEYQLEFVRATPVNIRPDELDSFIGAFQENVVTIVGWIWNAASLIRSEEMKLVELNKKIEELQKEFEAVSQALENLKLQQEMAEQMEKDEIVQVKDDASLEEVFRKFKNIKGSTSNTNDPSTDDYVALPGDINPRDEFADDRIKNKVAKKTNKVFVFVPLLSSWINFLVDVIYSVVEYAANGTFLLMLTIFSAVLPVVSFYFEYCRLKKHWPEPSFSAVSPKRGLAHSIILDVHPNFRRRSKALAAASAGASFLLFFSAFFRVLGLLNMHIFTISMVIRIAIAFIQMGITTIRAVENFENPRLVCVCEGKVEELTQVDGLEPPVYYCNCANCSIIQESSDDI